MEMEIKMNISSSLPIFLLLLLLFLPSPTASQTFQTHSYQFGPFNPTYYSNFSVIPNASITNGPIQLTPDTNNPNFSYSHSSGRALFRNRFRLFDESSGTVASFNSSFFINIFHDNSSNLHGEGLTFLISPNLGIPDNSSGQFLGLTNSTSDGAASNHVVAIEFDTFKQDFDPDDNHIGLDINSVRSNKTVSLSEHGLELVPNGTKYFHVWVQYNGTAKVIKVYMVDEDVDHPTKDMPQSPIMTAELDISNHVAQDSYFGFSASTGDAVELNCLLLWNLTVEALPSGNEAPPSGNGGHTTAVVVGVTAGTAATIGLCILGWYLYRRRVKNHDPNILGTLKNLPYTPREFRFNEIKKATNNFDERNKLGEGGFGVVYKGELVKENSVIAVKKFSRDSIKGQDDFLAELTIINRLRHKHLVKLLGWCHRNGTLLLVYEYMPNGSLDKHLFLSPDKQTLGWNLRYKIVSGVASALHYLHNEYDQKVLHRDLKASNIMLDSNFDARLGDFGLARAIDNEMTSFAEVDGVPGTFGYIAPECLHTGKASRESDVFGFGAVVLEVVCRQRPWTKVGPFICLVDWVWSLHRDGRILDAVDESLGGDFVVEEAERLLLLGLACSHPIAGERPKTQSIVQIISGSVPAPCVPPFKPAFMWPASSPMTDGGDTTDVTPMTLSTASQFGSGWTTRNASMGSFNVHTGSSNV